MEIMVEKEQFWLGRYDAPQQLPEQEPCFAAWIRGEYSLLAPRLPGQPGRSQGPWACLGVSGTLDLSLVGVMERLSRCLSEAGVPLLAQSTYDTDYLFVPMDRLDRAVEALRAAGFSVRRADGNDLAVATSNA